MVVKQDRVDLSTLDIGHLGFFLGLRMNELVVDAALRAGFTRIRESHGYVLQHFIDADRGITELARRMAVTQQAASKSVAELVAMGLLADAPATDRRSKRIRLSDAGRRLVELTRRTRRKLEKKLLGKIGKRSYDDARAALIKCLQTLGEVDRIASRRVRSPR